MLHFLAEINLLYLSAQISPSGLNKLFRKGRVKLAQEIHLGPLTLAWNQSSFAILL